MDKPNYIRLDEDDDDEDLLIYLYFRVQALETLWCKFNNCKLQKWQLYFLIIDYIVCNYTFFGPILV